MTSLGEQTSITVQARPRLDGDTSATWSAFASEAGLYQTAGWLKTLEDDALAAQTYLLASTTRRAGAVAGLPVYVVADRRTAGIYAPATLTERAALDAAEVDSYPLALVGTRAGYVTDFPLRGGTASSLAHEAVESLVSRSYELASAAGARTIGLLYLTSTAVRTLLRTGLVPREAVFFHDAFMYLATPYASFEAYVDELPPARRASVARELRSSSSHRLSTASCALSEARGTVISLFLNVQQHHGIPLRPDRVESFVDRQIRFLDDRSRVFVLRDHDGRPIAVSLGYVQGRVLYLRLVGLDYEAPRSAAAYFHVTFYEPIRFAIDRRLDGVHLGVGTYRPKVFRGASLEPLWGCVLTTDGETPLSPRACRRISAASAAAIEDELRGVEPAPGRAEAWSRLAAEISTADIASIALDHAHHSDARGGT